MSRINRRTFLLTTAACAACPLSALAAEAPKAPEPKAAEVGTLSDFPRDGVYDKFAPTHGFFIVRRKGKLYALGATCTHKKSLLVKKSEALACPAHGARFDLAGEVTKAPARKPLVRYAISGGGGDGGGGKIKVDPSKTFDKDHRNDKESFISVE